MTEKVLSFQRGWGCFDTDTTIRKRLWYCLHAGNVSADDCTATTQQHLYTSVLLRDFSSFKHINIKVLYNTTSSGTPPTLFTNSLNCCHQENGSGVIKVELTDLSTSSFHKLPDWWTADLEHVQYCTSQALSHSFSFKLLYLDIVCYLLCLLLLILEKRDLIFVVLLCWYKKMTIKLWLIDW